MAQVVERFVRDEEAASSSLVTPTERKPLSFMTQRFFVVFTRGFYNFEIFHSYCLAYLYMFFIVVLT